VFIANDTFFAGSASELHSVATAIRKPSRTAIILLRIDGIGTWERCFHGMCSTSLALLVATSPGKRRAIQ
jgi:hypothetical protein